LYCNNIFEEGLKMKKALRLFFVVCFAVAVGFLGDSALSLSFASEESNNADSSSPLFYASLESSLSDLSSSKINLNMELFSSQAAKHEATSGNSEREANFKIAKKPFPTLANTCYGSGGATCKGAATCAGYETCQGTLTCSHTCPVKGGATCRGVATCAGSQTCMGTITCGTTCPGTGGATCIGTATCSANTCSGRICEEMSPYR
jgi:hypothetical protein